MKEFADDNFSFDKNGRKFSRRVEKTTGKGEIASYEQFLLFPHSVFKRLVLQTRKSPGLFEKGLNRSKLHTNPRFTYEIAPVFTLMEEVVLQRMLGMIGWDDGDAIFSPGKLPGLPTKKILV